MIECTKHDDVCRAHLRLRAAPLSVCKPHLGACRALLNVRGLLSAGGVTVLMHDA